MLLSLARAAREAAISTTIERLRTLLGEPAFSRGLDYFRAGRVLTLSKGPLAGQWLASVEGSGKRPYTQRIELDRDRRAGWRLIESACDCPVGRNCKHVAAALIALATREAEPASAPARKPARLSPALDAWLARLRAADTPEPASRGAESDGYPDGVRDRLLYVLDVPVGGKPAVTTLKAALRKDGALGKSARRFDAAQLARGGSQAFLRPEDAKLLRQIDFLGLVGLSYAPYRGAPEPGEVMALLERIAATGRGRWADAHGPALTAGGARSASLSWASGVDGRQSPHVADGDGAALVVMAIDPPAYVDPASGAFGPLEFEGDARLALVLLDAPVIPPEAAQAVAEAMAALKTKVPAPRRIRAETRTGIAPTPVLRLFALTARFRRRWGSPGAPIILPALRVGFDYDGQPVAADTEVDPQRREGDAVVTTRRDPRLEKRAFDRLASSGAAPIDHLGHLSFERDAKPFDLAFADDPTADQMDGVDGESDALAFVAEAVPRLRAEGWRIEIDASWPYRLHDGPVRIRAALESGGTDWFALGLTLEVGDQRLDLAPLVRSVVAVLPLDADGAPEDGFDLDEFLEDLTLYQRMPDGAHVALKAATLAPLAGAVRGLIEGFHTAEAGRLPDLAEALDGCGVPFDGGDALLDLGRKLRALTAAPMAEPPAALVANLRPYQKAGYGWLRALAETGFGGVLADDMGLGKTVQTLALLAERHIERASDRPSLLIVPTSLVGTWRREATRFAPDLKVLALHGPDRHARIDEIAAHHLVITTYPLLHRDHATLLARDWELAILDEAQAAKNPASSAARLVRGVRARMRLALTGTPMENGPLDLWTLFDWLVPGLLGDRKTFNARFRTPIEKQGDAAAQAILNARVRPFLLRRTKGDVAADLPDKTEITEFVPLGDAQRGLYESIRVAMDARVRDAIAQKGLAASRITILDALLKLRQVCCDPGLVRQAGARPVSDSAKRARLIEMLEPLIAEGRRVLVFSQFVTMLRLIETDVKARGWNYAWLTGETRDREDVVASFQSGQAPLFLISLKAGGVGLTLTAADTVILYDPWWNPAVERQAMDRVHRIGQERAVFVYRLIAEGSVEQSIAALQARKQALADALFDASGDGPLALTEDDLVALFRPIGA